MSEWARMCSVLGRSQECSLGCSATIVQTPCMPHLQVFDAKDWAALMASSIVPRLGAALQQELSISPAAQNLAPWHWMAAWAQVLPAGLLVGLLESTFFPQWHAVLHHWLAHAPDYDQVTSWYLGWKVRAQSCSVVCGVCDVLAGLRQRLCAGRADRGRRGHASCVCSGVLVCRWQTTLTCGQAADYLRLHCSCCVTAGRGSRDLQSTM